MAGRSARRRAGVALAPNAEDGVHRPGNERRSRSGRSLDGGCPTSAFAVSRA